MITGSSTDELAIAGEVKAAVRNPKDAFADPDLKAGDPVVGPDGAPLPYPGATAAVYQVCAADDRSWAVKCYARERAGCGPRFARVAAALRRAGLPYTVGVEWLEEGIRVDGKAYPVAKMDWVEGRPLNQVVRAEAGNPAALGALLRAWVGLCQGLRTAGFAHGDLQHGNVLLVPAGRSGGYDLKLVDYDGKYVPALANSPSGEVGHPNYRHPTRAATRAYSPDLDRFPHLVVATAIQALAALGPGLWDKHDTGDNLLFTAADFRDPAASALARELWQADHPDLHALVGRLVLACRRPIPRTPGWTTWLRTESRSRSHPQSRPKPLASSA